jgi:fumarate reductase subunit C
VTQTVLWIAQRVTAAILAVCVVVHLATIIYAVQGGLTAAEILGRTRGNTAWLAFYIVFVVAAAIHAPIGLRPVLGEWLKWRGIWREVFLVFFAYTLLALGLQAVLGVFA